MKKKIRRWAAIALCAAMSICACSAEGGADGSEKPVYSDTKKKKKEKEYQKKLDMIKLSAYDNVMGLNLEEGTSLSIIGKAEGVSYWDEVSRGAKQAVKDINKNLGYEGKDQVEVTYSAPSTPDNVDEQVNILDEELARYPAALGIAIADTKACEVQFDLAAESDIPIVAFDSGSDYQGLMAVVSTNNREAAREAAERLAESVDEKGEVFLFIHDSKSESALSREQAFRETLEADYPEVTIAEVYYMDQLSVMQESVAAEMNGEQTGEETKGDGQDDGRSGENAGNNEGTEEALNSGENDDGKSEQEERNGGDGKPEQEGNNGGDGKPEQEGNNGGDGKPEQEENNGGDSAEGEVVEADMLSEEDVLDYLFEKHPEVKGIYATNGDAVKRAAAAKERNESDASIIGFDADREVLDALEEGKVEALVLQNPFGMGYAAIVASARAALSMGNEAVVDTGYIWLTKKNLADEEVRKLLY